MLEIRGIEHSKFMLSSNVNAVKTGMWSHYLGIFGAPAGGIVGTYSNHPFIILTNQQARLSISVDGNVGIGTTTPREKLSVNGNIRAREIKVEVQNWPDYVFEEDYKLPPLPSLKKYIIEFKYLPEVPTSKQASLDGINLGEMNKLLLKKIEELTLYLVELNGKYDSLVKEVNQLNKKS